MLRGAMPACALPLATLAIVLGCHGPVPVYDGPRLPRSEVALLKAAGKNRILTINGRQVDGATLELRPGNYAVLLQVERNLRQLNAMLRDRVIGALCGVWFRAEPGRSYVLTSRFSAPIAKEYDGNFEVTWRYLRVMLHGATRGMELVDARWDCKPLRPTHWRVGSNALPTDPFPNKALQMTPESHLATTCGIVVASGVIVPALAFSALWFS